MFPFATAAVRPSGDPAVDWAVRIANLGGVALEAATVAH